MQLNYDVFKRILNTMVERQSHYISVSKLIEESQSKFEVMDIDEYEDLFYGHLHLLKDNGLIQEVLGHNLGIQYSINGKISIGGCYIRLTSKGYDFYKILNKSGIMEKLKKFTLTECIKITENMLANGICEYINNF